MTLAEVMSKLPITKSLRLTKEDVKAIARMVRDETKKR